MSMKLRSILFPCQQSELAWDCYLEEHHGCHTADKSVNVTPASFLGNSSGGTRLASPAEAWTANSCRGLGIVYGDIGTSPLYVFQNIFLEVEPTKNDVLGATSLVLWTIVLIVLVKYSLVVLLADDNGEGKHSRAS